MNVLLLKFLIIALCNSSGNFLSKIFSLLIPLPEAFCQKLYKPMKQTHVTILNALTRNNLSASVLLFKSLKFP